MVLVFTAAISAGCSTTHRHVAPSSVSERPLAYRYFEASPADDGLSTMIGLWQSREGMQAIGGSPAFELDVASSPRTMAAAPGNAIDDLRTKYLSFREESRRRVAQDVVEWVQVQARHHYIPDRAIDHWATLEETFAKNGDDCDGLELLAYNLLLEHGFPREDVFRAVVRRSSDGMHHMVTFWFESPTDPWVLDPTGTMTNRMERMSSLAEWEPLRVFSEHASFIVAPASTADEHASRTH